MVAIQRCNYPTWVLNRLKIKSNNNLNTNIPNNNNKPNNIKENNIYVVVSYTKGLSESFMNICGKHWIQVHFKGVHQEAPGSPQG